MEINKKDYENRMLIKTFNTVVKGINEPEHIVLVKFSSFETIDSDGDIIDSAAADKWLEKIKDKASDEWKRLKILLDHNIYNTIGVPINVFKKEDGLYAEFHIPQTREGKDVWIKYKSGAITEHSFGFEVIDAVYDERMKANRILDIDIWEVSVLNAWGANKNTPLIGLKQMGNESDVINDKIKEVEALELENEELKNQIKVLGQKYRDLNAYVNYKFNN